MSVGPDSPSSPAIALGLAPSELESAPASSGASSSSFVGASTDEPRVLVRVTAIFGAELVSTDFRIPPSTALSKVLLVWCREHGCAPGDVRFTSGDAESEGQEVPLDTTAAALGANSMQAVIVQAGPQPGAEKRWHPSAPAVGSRHHIIAPGAAALGPAALHAAQLLSVRVVAETEATPGRAPSDDETQFWISPEVPMSRLMTEWCTHHGIDRADVRFFLNGQELLPGDSLQQWGFNTEEGSGSAGRAAIQISAEPSSAEAATRCQPLRPRPTQMPAPARTPRVSSSESLGRASSSGAAAKARASGETPRVQIRAEAVGSLASQVKDTSSSQTSGTKICRLKMGAPFGKFMDLWCQEHGLSKQSINFRIGNGRIVQAEDNAEKLGCHMDQEVVLYAELQPTAPPVDRRVLITVKGQDKLEEEGLDFKMLPETSFERLMRKWCDLHKVSIKEVAFILENGSAALRPHDSPVSVCPALSSSSGSTLNIRVLPAQKAPKASNRQTPESRTTASQQDAADATAKPSETEASDGRAVVIIEGEAAGLKRLKFRMRPTMMFEKVMESWCKSNAIQLDSARFNIDGKEITVQDTPMSCNWQLGGAPLSISAVLMRKPHQEQRTTVSPAAAPATTSATAPSAAPAAAPATTAAQVNRGTAAVTAPLSAYAGALAQASLTAAAAAASPAKAPPAVASSAAVAPAAAPPPGAAAAKASTAAKAAKAGTAAPVPAKSSTTAAAAGAKAPAKPPAGSAGAASATSGAEEKVMLEIVSELNDEPNITQLSMKCSTRLEKMMKAWCKHHEKNLEDVIFWMGSATSPDADGARHLTAQDSPASLGWSAERGVLAIQVAKRTQKDASSSSASSAHLPKSGISDNASTATSSKTTTEAALPKSGISNNASTASSSKATTEAALPPDKVVVHVVAEDETGPTSLEFKMKSGTAFEKMMKKWCESYEIPPEEARFVINNRELRPEDTPASCGWSPRQGALTIHAFPRDPDETIDAIASVATPARTPELPVPSNTASVASKEAPAKSTSAAGASVLEGASGSAPSTGTPADSRGIAEVATPPEKITVQVVAEGEDGPAMLDFKMSQTTLFEKMMWKWCENYEVPLEEARFLLPDQRELRPEYSPCSIGWSAQKGVLTINVLPREPEKDSEDRVPAAAPVKASELLMSAEVAAIDASKNTGVIRATAQASSSTLPGQNSGTQPVSRTAPKTDDKATTETASQPEKIEVQVIAEGEDGPVVSDFKMKANTAFDKMMRKWCEACEVPLEEARFVLPDQRELRPEDTPESCGWSAQKGVLKVNALPREEPAPDHSSPSAASGKIVDVPIPGSTAAAVQSSMPIETNAPPADTSPPATIAETSAVKATLPTPGVATETSQVVNGDATATDSKATTHAEPPPEKVMVQVLAEGEEGPTTLDFKMKSNTAFAKMMSKWCETFGVPVEEARFVLSDDREVQPEDSPESFGWSSQKGVLIINAVPRDSAAPDNSEADTAPGVPATGTDVPVAASEIPPADTTAPGTTSAADNGATSEATPPPEKIMVQVVAEGENGPVAMEFKMKPTTAFEKMMSKWCEANEVPAEEARFVLPDQRELRPEDTPESCGWSSQKGSLVINAMPRETDEQSDHEAAAAAQARTSAAAPPPQTAAPVAGMDAPAGMSDMPPAGTTAASTDTSAAMSEERKSETAAPVINTATADHLASSTNLHDKRSQTGDGPDGPEKISGSLTGAASAPDNTAAVAVEPAPEKVTVQVVAEGEEGSTTLDFKMKANTAFEKMMSKWCENYEIPLEEASFLLSDDRELRPEDTPESCGWSPQKGILVVTVVPRDSTGVSDDRASALTAPDVVASKETPTVGSAPQDPGTAAPEPAATTAVASAAEPKTMPSSAPSAEVKINVQVVARCEDGTNNVIDVKMKLTSPFEKMMKAWCQHTGFELAEVQFLRNGRPMQMQDTPESLGWKLADGDLVIDVQPRVDNLEDQSSQAEPNMGSTAVSQTPADVPTSDAGVLPAQASTSEVPATAPATQTPAGVPTSVMDEHLADARTSAAPANTPATQSPADVPTSAASELPACAPTNAAPANTPASSSNAQPDTGPNPTSEPADDQQVIVSVAAADGNGEVVFVDFKMKPHLPFKKMMQAWCKHQGLPSEAVAFTIDDRTLQEDDTPASVGWTAMQGKMQVNAAPRPKTRGRGRGRGQGRGRGSQASQTKADGAGPANTVEVKVIASGPQGDNILNVTMKPNTKFEKMMDAWCKNNAISRPDVVFLLEDGRELKGSDSPKNCGAQVSLTIRAKPRASAQNGGSSSSSHSVPTEPCSSSQAAEQPQLEEKVAVRIVAQAADGEVILEYKLAPSAPFGTIAKQWYAHHSLPVGSARFLLDGMVVLETDTMIGLGRRSPQGPIRVVAEPKGDQEEGAAPQASASSSAAPAPSAALPDDAGIHIVVLAEGADGLCEDRYRLKMLTPLEKVMSAWSNAHGIPVDEAMFLLGSYDGGEKSGAGFQFVLRKTDSLAELRRRFGAKVVADAGLVREDAEVVVKVVPAGMFEEAVKARDKLEAQEARDGISRASDAPTAKRRRKSTAKGDATATSAAGETPSRVPKRQRSSASMVGTDGTPVSSQAPKKRARNQDSQHQPRRRRSTGTANAEAGASSDCSGAPSDGGETQGLRRSARLREGPQISSTTTIIHHAPESSQKRPRKDKQASGIDAVTSTEKKDQYMSFEEYLKYDREQERLVARAREERQKRMLVSGVEDEDEEYQMAVALSLSIAAGASDDVAPKEKIPAPSDGKEISSTSPVPTGEQLEEAATSPTTAAPVLPHADQRPSVAGSGDVLQVAPSNPAGQASVAPPAASSDAAPLESLEQGAPSPTTLPASAPDEPPVPPPVEPPVPPPAREDDNAQVEEPTPEVVTGIT